LMLSDEATLKALSGKVIGCAIRVSNELGPGFLEKVYENALAHELRKAGIVVSQQQRVTIFYDEVVVGEYLADLMVDSSLLVEVKAVRELDNIHRAQCMNYLKATGLHLCLLVNFAKPPRLEIKRIVLNL
jgi:GxxExxY protein